MPYYTAIVTLVAVALYFFIATQVAVGHRRYDVKLPKMTGHPDFERVQRAHANMLEWLPTFLAPLWICAYYLNDLVAAGLGLLWVVGRAVYFAGYSKAVEKRRPGFAIQAVAWMLLMVGAVAGLVMHALR